MKDGPADRAGPFSLSAKQFAPYLYFRSTPSTRP